MRGGGGGGGWGRAGGGRRVRGVNLTDETIEVGIVNIQ